MVRKTVWSVESELVFLKIRILVATDLHVGYGERILERDLDSIRALEEVLQIAIKQNVDFILLGGDLYHENNPSREMQHRVTRLLRRYCLNERPVALQFLSDPSANFMHSAFNNVNYEDCNINVGLPIFTIHGNHDDLSGKGLSALDLLHEAGLINLFGKFEEIDKFVVSPVLLRKGKTNLAIYGIGSQRDDRLCRAFREGEIRFLRPLEDPDSWFEILVLHQNRPRRSKDRSTGAHLPENLIPSFFDLVVWGHEHECKIGETTVLRKFSGYIWGRILFNSACADKFSSFYIMQPGSTIATSLSPEEAIPKHCAIVTVYERKFFSTPIRLETPRQILFDDLAITEPPPPAATKTSRTRNMPDEKLIAAKLNEMLAEGCRTRLERQPKLPLVRLRVTYSEPWLNVMKLNCRRFGLAYTSAVANPGDMVTIKILKPRNERRKTFADEKLFASVERAGTLEDLVNSRFTGPGARALTVLTAKMLKNVVKAHAEGDEAGVRGRARTSKPLIENIRLQKEKLISQLCKINYDFPDQLDAQKKKEELEELVEKDIMKAQEVRIRHAVRERIADENMLEDDDDMEHQMVEHRKMKKDVKSNIHIDLQEQVDALSANRDNTKLVAAGSKGLMKIFSTENATLKLIADMRSVRTRKLNLMYSASHVAWSPVVDNIIATTSTNGAVVLWDVEKAAIEQIYKAHNRSATKVCFHRTDRNTFISGAKDAVVAQYDLRSANYVQKFISGSFDPIRDIQFGLHSEQMDIFVSADDGGSIRFWDLRRNDRPLRQFVAHHGPASIALNPSYDDRNLIATAGRDKFIRIWKWSDWSESGINSEIYSVESTTPVARVQWRPQHKYQVASCAVVNDINIYVWDIRRPFLPFASFDDHRDMCCDMIWNPELDDCFVSAAKDGLVVMHYFNNAQYPLTYVNDIALDVSPNGEIVIALSDQLKLKNESLADRDKLDKGEAIAPRRRRYDPFQSWTHSSLIRCVPREAQKSLSQANFVYLALNYKLSGSELETLCEYNSEVAERIGNCELAHTWRMLSLLCSLSPFFEEHSSKRNSSSSGEQRRNTHHFHNSAEENEEDELIGSRFSSNRSSMGAAYRTAEGSDEQLMTGNGGGGLFGAQIPSTLSETADFYFGDAELNLAGLVSDPLDTDIFCSPLLRTEAFLPRPCEELEQMEERRSMSSDEISSTCTTTSNTAEESEESAEQYCSQMGKLSFRNEAVCLPPWDPLPIIQSMFMQYSEVGDVQTCVSILLVLGERAADLIDASLQKLWFLDYLEMLDRYELCNTSAEVIKLCWIPSISNLSNEGTFLRLVCQHCKAVSASVSPFCKKCHRKFNFTCAICAMPVRGVWGWCRVCRHGGHPEHLAEWFASDNRCPTGCGHLCTPGTSC
ncbi:unnamed protein product [Anisakis simplex]|uniref:GATOR complex protein WDR24 n=1 Tax=Anisakis simplex TaxID=6269 RepID=A0A0M3JW53_ANISI|nr:unnamed protein product [Anisakis simplex]